MSTLMTTEALIAARFFLSSAFRPRHIPMADSRMSVSISSTSSSFKLGTWGPRTLVWEAARISTSEPFA